MIGEASPLEIIPYIIEMEGNDDVSDRSTKRVRLASHRDTISPALLRRASGVPEKADTLLRSLLGCGSVGWKVAVHMARLGNPPLSIVDKSAMQPHNFARHAVLPLGVNAFLMPPKAHYLDFVLLGFGPKNRAVYASGCGADRPRHLDRHQGRDGRGLKHKQEIDMSLIGSFSASGKEYVGEIATLTIRTTNVRIAPVQRATDTGPTHRVYVGQAEVGAAWSKRSREGRSYLSVLLDDPSLLAPVYANLLADEDGRCHKLVWSRGKQRGGE